MSLNADESTATSTSRHGVLVSSKRLDDMQTTDVVDLLARVRARGGGSFLTLVARDVVDAATGLDAGQGLVGVV